MAKDQASAASAAIKSLAVGKYLTLHSRLERGGALQARRLSNGSVQLYWRYSHAGETAREPIGPYDAAAPPKKLEPTSRGYSIAAALEKCRELARAQAASAEAGGLRQARQQRLEAQRAQRAREIDATERSLQALMDAYVEHLKLLGRRSYVDARQIFKNHVAKPWPRLAAGAANALTSDQVLDLLRRPIERGKGRTANKLRSYLRAAYQCALDVHSTASIPAVFKRFEIRGNPVAQTRRAVEFDRADKRPLLAEELRTYWQLIRHRSGVEAAVLRLHLLSGAQRVEQFVRVLSKDLGPDSMTLFDGKGRPGQPPRLHRLPLIESAREAAALLPREGRYAISTTQGEKPISVRTMAAWARALVDEHIEGFQLKRIRSGVETLLASCGVSREIRGQLQSHGLSGVQLRHYDAHDYLPEKRQALELLLRQLEAQPTGAAHCSSAAPE